MSLANTTLIVATPGVKTFEAYVLSTISVIPMRGAFFISVLLNIVFVIFDFM